MLYFQSFFIFVQLYFKTSLNNKWKQLKQLKYVLKKILFLEQVPKKLFSINKKKYQMYFLSFKNSSKHALSYWTVFTLLWSWVIYIYMTQLGTQSGEKTYFKSFSKHIPIRIFSFNIWSDRLVACHMFS